MKRLRKGFLIFLMITMIMGIIYSNGLAWEKWKEDDPITDEWSMIDILVARPLGIATGIFGIGLFILSLPFTIPSNSVENAAEMFIERPFKFSFTREFPDDDM
jgi:hypothetical protein